MTRNLKTLTLCKTIFILVILAGCNNEIERSGIVVDRQTKQPLQDVSIEIYMKTQRRDSLKEKVFTDTNGHFFIKEKRDKGQLFILEKSGYISHTSSIAIKEDTLTLERKSN